MTQQATTTIPDACETLKIFWLRANRGKLATIAHKLGIKAQTVYRVYWGEANSKRILRALKHHGAPMKG